MIGLPRGVSVYAFDEPCDMRKSFDTLAALVTEHMKHDVLTGDLYLFVSRDRRRAKVLYFDGTGMCLLAKRLEKGQFTATWKRAKSARGLSMTLSELSLFIEGSEVAARMPLSPSLLSKSDLRTKFPDNDSLDP
ncbi:MAG: transposase [Candidatus Eremiobacteraeota bacterium]|nr:transposase [Candidatus Eremiobacteraeota bacterium]